MGVSSGGPEAYDYNLSIDYGVCYGPVDHINQIWVKDKPIWCGRARSRRDIYTYQPDLFGGEEKEGGVVGTVEFYPGDDDQESSAQLSARYNLTPETMPGYRGLCHLFFRGGNPGGSGDVDYFASLAQHGAGQSAGLQGFRWVSNNPYLPGMKVSTTRIPRSLNDNHAVIWPIEEIDPDTGDVTNLPRLTVASDIPDPVKSPVEVWPYPYGYASDYPALTTTLDLLDLGLAADERALGGTELNVAFAVHVQSFGEEYDTEGRIQITALDEDENQLGVGAVQSYSSDDDGEVGFLDLELNYAAPPGTRYLVVRAWFHIELALGAWWNVTKTSSFARVPKFEYVHCDPKGTLGDLPDANPAHVLHEILVNPEWGKGEDPDLIDLASFEEAASTLFDEAFGISFIWRGQTEIEKVCQEVLDHIKASLYQSPSSGLWELKLWRDDYEASTLPELNPSNCTLESRRRRAWGETINEIVVSYTDPSNEKEATVTSHNLANIQIQGGVISDTRNYHMVRNSFLAQKIADRDVRESGHPLFTASVRADRSMWKTKPGSVLRLTWPEDGIDQMVVRVQKVHYGDDKDRTIRLDVVEDIFALEATRYSAPGGPLYADPDNVLPEPLDVDEAVTLPATLMSRATGRTIEEIDDNFPAARVAMIAAHYAHRFIDAEVHAPKLLQTGETEPTKLLTMMPTPWALLSDALPEEAQSTLVGAAVQSMTGGDPSPGDLLMIGDTEELHEIVMLDAPVLGTPDWTILRGLYDTVPRAWPGGTPVFKFPTKLDPEERAAGETIDYRFLMRTPRGRYPYLLTPDATFTVSERPFLPIRPANTQLGGAGFATFESLEPGSAPSTVSATWETRNRAAEDTSAFRWGDASTTPEAGQTVRLRVLDSNKQIVEEIAGLTGASYDFAFEDLAEIGEGFVEFWAERGGELSFMAAQRAFVIAAFGYGVDYGNYYDVPPVGYGNHYSLDYG